MIWADIGRALALATIPLAALFGVLGLAQLYAVALAVSALTILFDLTYQAYLPALVGKEHVMEGNSKFGASAAVAEFAGFGGGWLVQLLTAFRDPGGYGFILVFGGSDFLDPGAGRGRDP
jgi:hypothetical protein